MRMNDGRECRETAGVLERDSKQCATCVRGVECTIICLRCCVCGLVARNVELLVNTALQAKDPEESS